MVKRDARGRFLADPSKQALIDLRLEATAKLRLDRLVKAIERANEGSLRAVGFVVATIAKGKIKRSRTEAPPGSPPTTRRGLMRRAIRYAVADDKKSVVIGPVGSLVGKAGSAHEFGGRYRGGRYPVRAFMGPSLEEALPQIGRQWTGSLI